MGNNTTPQRAIKRRKPRSPMANREKLEAALVGAKSKKDVLINLGLRAAGGNYAALDRWANEHGIELPVDDKSQRTRNALAFIRIPDSEVFVEDSTYANTAGLKKRMIENGFPHECAICGQGDEWNGRPLVLQLDHINGRSNDHRKENLRFLCPNCHAQTFSYRGYNAKPPKKCECGKTINAASKRCRQCHAKNRENNTTHCPRGHELVMPNLRPAALRDGKRICLACDRARSYCVSRGIRGQMQEISDQYYDSIMADEKAA